ncbi:hypothetical protein CVT24_011233 [Panaeolus cyanescens]|uniref:Uncharacterized protein n=1 Tax=Panaeolus cyanescens TaxID=181874 RepID=A0A409YGF3_9AGAR|nr:hypothetical protein CVT24_011233 [Panaeolus cyanescens]
MSGQAVATRTYWSNDPASTYYFEDTVWHRNQQRGQTGPFAYTDDKVSAIMFVFPIPAIRFNYWGHRQSYRYMVAQICTDCDFLLFGFDPFSTFDPNARDDGPPVMMYSKTFSKPETHRMLLMNFNSTPLTLSRFELVVPVDDDDTPPSPSPSPSPGNNAPSSDINPPIPGPGPTSAGSTPPTSLSPGMTSLPQSLTTTQSVDITGTSITSSISSPSLMSTSISASSGSSDTNSNSNSNDSSNTNSGSPTRTNTNQLTSGLAPGATNQPAPGATGQPTETAANFSSVRRRTGPIIGAVIGVIIFLLLLSCLLWRWRRSRRRAFHEALTSESDSTVSPLPPVQVQLSIPPSKMRDNSPMSTESSQDMHLKPSARPRPPSQAVTTNEESPIRIPRKWYSNLASKIRNPRLALPTSEAVPPVVTPMAETSLESGLNEHPESPPSVASDPDAPPSGPLRRDIDAGPVPAEYITGSPLLPPEYQTAWNSPS